MDVGLPLHAGALHRLAQGWVLEERLALFLGGELDRCRAISSAATTGSPPGATIAFVVSDRPDKPFGGDAYSDFRTEATLRGTVESVLRSAWSCSSGSQ